MSVALQDFESALDTTPPVAATAKGRKDVFYFDLETVPDYSRQDCFDLDAVPDEKPRARLETSESMQWATAASVMSLELLTAEIKAVNPPNQVLDILASIEQSKAKPRKGVFDLIADCRNQDADREDLLSAQRKKMATTPEMCRIVAMGWHYNGVTDSLLVTEDTAEQDVLQIFWDYAKMARSICGFNISGFDIPVIYVRSILLGIEPSRQFDLKPWGDGVIDLMQKRFPRSNAVGLKKLCKMMGIYVPAGDFDGSMVEEMMEKDPQAVLKYVRSDVNICVAMHHMYHGFFC